MKIYGVMAHGLVPEEIIIASGGFPLRLSLIDRQAAIKGMEYLTAITCSFAQSTIGYFEIKNELYHEVDAIVAGNYCNGELCATELIAEYFKIPRIDIVFPSTKNESAVKFMLAELTHFKEDLEQFSGKQVTNSEISKAIALYNNERKLIQQIVQLQAEKGQLLSGVQCLQLLYWHFLFGTEVSIEHLQNTITKLKEDLPVKEGTKIIFAGNGVPIGDNTIELIENFGFMVNKNLTWTGLDYYSSLVDENTEPLEALARYYVNSENSGRMILSDDYFKNLINIYDNSNADGIIFYTIKNCSLFPSVISKKLKGTLSERQIPFLEIERDYGTTSEAQLQTRLQAFKEMIK